MNTPQPELNRRSGVSIIELAVAINLLTIVILAVGVTITHGMKHCEESENSYQALISFKDLLAEIQEVANTPQDLSQEVGIGAVYQRYHGAEITMGDGTTIQVTCYPDEATVPTSLGGRQDLNFDGDAADNLGNESKGVDLKLVPMEFEIAYDNGGWERSLRYFRLITRTAN